MHVKGGKLEFLVPHLIRGQFLRRGVVGMSLRLGFAQQMPSWAKLQFTNAGVSRHDLDRVLSRIDGLTSWVDEWESLGRHHEQGGRDALALARPAESARRFLAASAAYNFAQYVLFLDIGRKRQLHEACVRSYASAGPLLDPPARPFEVLYRRRVMEGMLRVPRGVRRAPVVVLFNGTNAVKEELHWWAESLLDRGVATICFDGPGLGRTFHRLSTVAEPRPAGVAILNEIENHPELDSNAVAFLGMSLGGYMAIQMATHDRRIRAVAAVSPPYSADIYWNVTLAALRNELAALYNISERDMGATIERITLADVLPDLRCPLMVSGGGRDHITPGSEAWRIFEGARCDRELVYYPKGLHDCFNVLEDLRPRIVSWLASQLERHHPRDERNRRAVAAEDGAAFRAAEAVDLDFAEELCGEVPRLTWNRVEPLAPAARWAWPWEAAESRRIDVVRRMARTGVSSTIPA
jgi:2,6-dihydroxypseudooxynicotine hydrolase